MCLMNEMRTLRGCVKQLRISLWQHILDRTARLQAFSTFLIRRPLVRTCLMFMTLPLKLGTLTRKILLTLNVPRSHALLLQSRTEGLGAIQRTHKSSSRVASETGLELTTFKSMGLLDSLVQKW